MRHLGLANKIAVTPAGLSILFYGASTTLSQDLKKIYDEEDCEYYMCQCEKENIDTIILENAKTNQTVMFGEIHDSVIEGHPFPIEDSLYVITLLLRLKEIGYEYLALEVNKKDENINQQHTAT